jgi:predicted amidophosphoribosyltransferase
LPSHVAIIDDVLTSGHTANEVTKLVKNNGVDMVEVWTIARTIRHDGSQLMLVK